MGKEALYIHMLGVSMYTKNLYEMLNIDFNGKRHIFATGRVVKEYYSVDDVSGFGKKEAGVPTRLFSPRFFWNLYRCDGVIIHALFSFVRVAFFFVQPWLWKKCNWIVWGGDLYSARQEQKSVPGKLREWMKRCMIPHLGYVTTITEGDQELVKKWYGYKGEFYRVTYPIPLQKYEMKETLAQRQNLIKTILNIVIGNSATQTNQHKEALNMLANFKNENIHIFLPLSYGFDEWETYGKSIESYAASIFGKEKVTALYQRMSGDEYTNFMRKMHIAIYNNDRQQAMGNIAIMLGCGAKVFIRRDNNMWKHYQQQGHIMYATEDIASLTYEKFIDMPDEVIDLNFKLLFQRNDRKLIIDKWKKLFDAMS